MRLAGKTTFITAAGNGMGRAAALAFAAEGARVIATDIDAAALESLAKPAIRTHVLDVCDGEAVRRIAGTAGPVDVLFNCAGIVHHGTLLECDDAAWALISMDVNAGSMHRVTRALLPGMLAAGRGSIINMASMASSIKGFPMPRKAAMAANASGLGFALPDSQA
jgi:NAD(P)-dependent dehydrogenase (short-subunit alcohol dehydrogenase family)